MIWTVVSAGHPGKTSFVLNTGFAYARRHPDRKILVVDFNFLKPDVAIFLDLVDYTKNLFPKSLEDLYPLISGYQAILLERFVTRPYKNLPNYWVLPGFLLRNNLGDALDRTHWAYFFEQLLPFADLIIFDTDQNLHSVAFQYLFGASDLFLLLMDQDKLASIQARYLLSYFKSRGRLNDLKLLLLRVDSDNPFSANLIKNIVQHEVTFEIPNIPRSKYEEQFDSVKLVALDVKHPFTLGLEAFLDEVEGHQPNNTQTNRRNLWTTVCSLLHMKRFSQKPKDISIEMNSQQSSKTH